MNKHESIFTPAVPTDVSVNPIQSNNDWAAMRDACEADAGGFHGEIAGKTIHWFNEALQAWLMQDADGRWAGWNAQGEAVSLEGQPWSP